MVEQLVDNMQKKRWFPSL